MKADALPAGELEIKKTGISLELNIIISYLATIFNMCTAYYIKKLLNYAKIF